MTILCTIIKKFLTWGLVYSSSLADAAPSILEQAKTPSLDVIAEEYLESDLPSSFLPDQKERPQLDVITEDYLESDLPSSFLSDQKLYSATLDDESSDSDGGALLSEGF